MQIEGQQMRCPKCGHRQPRAETCRQCGIVIHKYAARRPSPRSAPRRQNGFPFRLVSRLLQFLFLVSLGLTGWAYWHKDRLPDPDFYQQRLLGEPQQGRTSTKPFDILVNGIVYHIEPVADYRLHGVVVSLHDSDAFIDVYHHTDWKDFINIRDLCVIWGGNVSSGVYREMEFENTTWTCWAWWPNREVGNRFDMRQLSNNHLLAHDPQVHHAIMQAEPGDQVSFSGQLARYSHSNGAFKRGTSTTRTDTGNGACETVFVEDFRIVQKANTGSRRLYGVALTVTALTLVGLLAMLFLAPVRRR